MDSSGDSFVSFKHFPELDICPTDWVDKLKLEYVKKKHFWSSKLKLEIKNLEEFQGKDCLESDILHTQNKACSLKADLESRIQIVNELKIKCEILESELQEIVGTTSLKEIEDLTREVITLENDKKQRIEKLINHRDTIIKCLDYYKHFLDCHLTFCNPDTFTFYFNKVQENGKMPENWIKVRTDDFKYWQFVEGTISLEEKTEVCRILNQTGSIQWVLCEVRKIFLK